MTEAVFTRTNDYVNATGTYVSTCPCLARCTFSAGQSATPCPICRASVAWRYYDLTPVRALERCERSS